MNCLEQVFTGTEPDAVLRGQTFTFTHGEPPDLLLKAYKWIWGQEDCNYPNLQGREMCMVHIRKLRRELP